MRARLCGLVVGFLAVCALLGAVTVSTLSVRAAGPYYVGSVSGRAFVAGTDDLNCTTIANTTCTIRGALSLATSGSDTIQFGTAFPQGGTIVLTQSGGNTIPLSISVTIDGGTKAPVLSGGCTDCGVGGAATNGRRVLVVSNGVTANLTGLTISAGNNSAGPSAGILNLGTLTLTDCTVSGNAAPSGNGGGIGNDSGTLMLVHTTVSGNSAVSGAFGGGAGIFNYDNGTVILTNSTVSGNNGRFGGGIYNYAGTMVLVNSTVSGNTGSLQGGGIWNSVGGTLALANSTISGNTTTGEGGGIYFLGGSEGITLTNTTVSGNTAGTQGGGIYNSAAPVMRTNSIVAGNTQASGGDEASDGGGTFAGSNNVIGGDPRLNPLANNGGLTQTMLPYLDSPAVDAYDPTGGNCGSYTDPITAATVPITTDQRGLVRPQGTKCDIGAVDIVGPHIYYVGNTNGRPVVVGTDTVGCAIQTNTTCTLRGALSLAVAGDIVRFGTTFPQGGTIKATDGGGDMFTLTTSVTVDGGTKAPVLSGGCTGCGVAGGINYSGGVIVLRVTSGVTASLIALTITAGNSGINHDIGAGIGNSGTLTLTNVSVRDNTLKSGSGGGGIYNDGTLLLMNSTVTGNYVESASGGGIYSTGAAAAVTLVNSTVSGNSAGSFAGGIQAFGGTLTLTDSTVSNNVSNEGGGIYNNATVMLTNSTVSGNSASHDGGGIQQSSGQTTLVNSTVSGNQASDQAGGIFLANGSTVTRTNSIVAGNTQTSGGDEVILFNNGTLAGNGNLIGVAPLLATLGNYGGPTQTMPPLPGSPAIDPAVPATCSGPTALDQRGKPHVGACDIGAVESQGFIFAATSGDHQTSQATRPFAQPLTVILSEFGAPGVPLAGAGITVSGPGTGAGILAATPATTNASGLASISVTANGTVGANYHVTATAGGTTSATFTLTNAPYVTIAGAASGDVRGGTPLVLSGAGFVPGNTTVAIDGVPVTPTSVTATAIHLTTPAHAAGVVDVTVTVNGVTTTLPGRYTYGVVTSLPGPRPSAPSNGPAPNPLPVPRP